MTALDSNGQPVNKKFSANRNKEKAVYGLKGILIGLVADQKLDEQELLFLDVWLRSQEYLKDDGDVIDLLDLVGDILADKIVTDDELKELQGLIDDIIDYKEMATAGKESQINELVGLLSGISADNIITDSEFKILADWLSCNEEVAQSWPANVIIERLNNIFEDEIVTQEEREDFLSTIKQITGVDFEVSGMAHGMSTEFFEDKIDTISHKDTCFCFTGTFVSGSRKVMENSVIERGATTKGNVTKSINYLVIGTLASRDWRYSSHGRKIEQALKLKEKGHQIYIITERTLLNFT